MFKVTIFAYRMIPGYDKSGNPFRRKWVKVSKEIFEVVIPEEMGMSGLQNAIMDELRCFSNDKEKYSYVAHHVHKAEPIQIDSKKFVQRLKK